MLLLSVLTLLIWTSGLNYNCRDLLRFGFQVTRLNRYIKLKIWNLMRLVMCFTLFVNVFMSGKGHRGTLQSSGVTSPCYAALQWGALCISIQSDSIIFIWHQDDCRLSALRLLHLMESPIRVNLGCVREVTCPRTFEMKHRNNYDTWCHEAEKVSRNGNLVFLHPEARWKQLWMKWEILPINKK